jgi:hypothetical protein
MSVTSKHEICAFDLPASEFHIKRAPQWLDVSNIQATLVNNRADAKKVS